MVAIPIRVYAIAAGVLAGGAATSEAQSPRALVGLVKDSLGHAIAGAEVRARGNVVVAFSDDSGRFHVAQMPVGARGVFVRRLGFAPTRVPITVGAGVIDSVRVTLRAIVHALPEITVQEQHDSLSRKVLAEFWARRARGFGKFVTRDEIQQKGSHRFVDVVRSVSGVQIMSRQGRQDIRFRGAGAGSMFRDCPPQYWLDGIPLQSGSADEFSPDNVEAIELYAGPATTPPQFTTRSQTCGTVIVWSRLPG
ncbi:MAG TPA: carboxypeptidase regulatory-like domain-containing protein [Gemmatimonadaceae bacterium]|nr:carboxypeptidase regulatory-like domain-containing protein [Gemmatimonadaceae bacterium]